MSILRTSNVIEVGGKKMQYLLLIYDEEQVWAKMADAERGSIHQAYGAFGKQFAGSIVGGNALQPT